MPSIVRQAYSPCSSEQMFQLVNQVTKYPEFIPWCQKADIIEHQPSQLTARLHLQKGPFNQSFVTCNGLQPNKRMSMSLVEGPFKKFAGLWQFEQQPQQSMISFELHYEFTSRFLAITAGPVFHQLADELVDIFLQRAKQVYG